MSSRVARQEADALADRLLGVGGRAAEPVEAALRRFEQTALPRAFAVQLVQRLRDQDPAVTPALRWLDERLAAQGTTADEIVREEHQRQGAMNVTVRNVITSMRLMSAVDWAELFESVSLVDAALRADSDFAAMDFPTRDQYRHAIEELARGSGLARAGSDTTGDCRDRTSGRGARRQPRHARPEQDPGYFLISRGRRAFEREIGFRVPIRQWVARTYAAAGILGYLATIAVVTAVVLAVPLLALAAARSRRMRPCCSLPLPLSCPASDAAVALVNRHVTNQFGPKALPGMELRDGVPASLRTLVAVPTLLTTQARRSRSRSSTSRCIISPVRRTTSASLCSRTGRIPGARARPATRSFSLSPPPASRASMNGTEAGRMVIDSSCCIAGASGTTARESGSVGNASAASCTS